MPLRRQIRTAISRANGSMFEVIFEVMGWSSTAPVPGGSVMFPDIAHSKAIG
jgi:hypothetical protein